MGDGEYRDRSSRFLTSAKAMELRCTFLERGDVLVARMPDPLGRACIFPGDAKPAVTVVDVAVVRPRNAQVNNRWLMYRLNAPTFRRAVAGLQSGSTRQRISRKNLASIPFHVPPRDQQDEAVAEIDKQFSRLDEAVANLQRVKANLSRYKHGVLRAATSGALLGKGREDELPDGWKWAEIGELANVVRGGSPRPAGDPKYFGGPVPWITVGPITADESDYLRTVPTGLTEAGRERSRYIEPHTLLLTNSGATLGVPKITLIGGCINDGVAALLGVDYPLKRYLLIYLRTKTAQMRMLNQGAAQPNLNTSIIKGYKVPVPPEADQHLIVAEVDRRLSIARGVEAEVDANLKRAQALRQAVLARAFSGEPLSTEAALLSSATAMANAA